MPHLITLSLPLCSFTSTFTAPFLIHPIYILLTTGSMTYLSVQILVAPLFLYQKPVPVWMAFHASGVLELSRVAFHNHTPKIPNTWSQRDAGYRGTLTHLYPPDSARHCNTPCQVHPECNSYPSKRTRRTPTFKDAMTWTVKTKLSSASSTVFRVIPSFNK